MKIADVLSEGLMKRRRWRSSRKSTFATKISSSWSKHWSNLTSRTRWMLWKSANVKLKYSFFLNNLRNLKKKHKAKRTQIPNNKTSFLSKLISWKSTSNSTASKLRFCKRARRWIWWNANRWRMSCSSPTNKSRRSDKQSCKESKAKISAIILNWS